MGPTTKDCAMWDVPESPSKWYKVWRSKSNRASLNGWSFNFRIFSIHSMLLWLGNCDSWQGRGVEAEGVKNVSKLEKIPNLHPFLLSSPTPLTFLGGNICIVSPPPPLPLNLPLNVALGNHPCPRPTRNILSHPYCQQVRFIKYFFQIIDLLGGTAKYICSPRFLDVQTQSEYSSICVIVTDWLTQSPIFGTHSEVLDTCDLWYICSE